MSFKRTSQIGKQGEKIILDHFIKNGIDIESNTDKNTRIDYDLIGKIGRTKFTIEVKYDYMAEKTGNVAIEYHNDQQEKPSGIDATKADLWAHVILDTGFATAWITSVKKLKEYINKNTPKRVVNFAGDGNASIYLYDMYDITQRVFLRLDGLSTKDFQKKIKELLK